MDKLIEIINSSDKIAVVSHIDPDGDTLGGALALAMGLNSLGKRTKVFCDGTVSYVYDFMPGIDSVRKLCEGDDGIDLAIAVDCADLGRLGDNITLFKSGVKTAGIDHHVSNTEFCDINIVDVDKSSSCEIVYHILQALGVKIDSEIATLLYVGISTDTGNFSYSNINKSCFVTAGELYEYDVDIPYISYMLYRRRTLAKTRLIGRAISNIKMYMDGSVSYMYIGADDLKETKATESDFEGVVDYARDIIRVEVAICAKQVGPGCYKVNFRSQDKVDVQQIARQYGGGGHKGAAGCTIRENFETTISEIIQTVIRKLEECRQVEL